MRALLLASVVLLLSCQSQHHLAQTSTDLMGDFSPVGSYQVKRRYTFILPFDASVYIANPVNTLLTDDGVDINSLLVEKLKAEFSQNFAQVYMGFNKERFNQAIESAQQMGAQFLVFGRVERWSNIKPIPVKQCLEDPDSDACQDDEEQEAEGSSKVAVSIYEATSGKLVDLVTVSSQRGVSAYLYDDNHKALEQIVANLVSSLSERR